MKQTPISITKVSSNGGMELIYLCRALREKTGLRKGDRVMVLVGEEPGSFTVKKLKEPSQKVKGT